MFRAQVAPPETHAYTMTPRGIFYCTELFERTSYLGSGGVMHVFIGYFAGSNYMRQETVRIVILSPRMIFF